MSLNIKGFFPIDIISTKQVNESPLLMMAPVSLTMNQEDSMHKQEDHSFHKKNSRPLEKEEEIKTSSKLQGIKMVKSISNPHPIDKNITSIQKLNLI